MFVLVLVRVLVIDIVLVLVIVIGDERAKAFAEPAALGESVESGNPWNPLTARVDSIDAMERKLQIVVRNGKPAAVILDIRDYEKLLERVEDAHDLRRLRSMREGRFKFRPLSDVAAYFFKTSLSAFSIAFGSNPRGPGSPRNAIFPSTSTTNSRSGHPL